MVGLNTVWFAAAFETELGWMAMLGRESVLRQLSIGNKSPAEALASLDHDGIAAEGSVLRVGRWNSQLAARLQAFSEGVQDDFLDVEIDSFDRTKFAQQVINCCRRIPCGQTLSYGGLARQAKAPRAARAVGSVMATNRVALIIPCHRVVRSDGGIGGYTSPAGIELKRRLLALEAKMGGARIPKSGRHLASC